MKAAIFYVLLHQYKPNSVRKKSDLQKMLYSLIVFIIFLLCLAEPLVSVTSLSDDVWKQQIRNSLVPIIVSGFQLRVLTYLFEYFLASAEFARVPF